jgi:hypothetical protein
MRIIKKTEIFNLFEKLLISVNEKEKLFFSIFISFKIDEFLVFLDIKKCIFIIVEREEILEKHMVRDLKNRFFFL